MPSTGPVPPATQPCRDSSFWPYSILSEAIDLRVHFRTPDEFSVARDVITAAAMTLSYQRDVLGFRRPDGDGGRCGPDGAVDIFLWSGAQGTFTDVVAPNHQTWWDDGYPHVVLDAAGSLGGRHLATTVTHELNHILQAADAWHASPIIYEMTALFVETLAHPESLAWVDYVDDFQRHPEWRLDHDDGSETLYMYGSAIYLQYLRSRHFPDEPSFIGDIWLGMRRPTKHDGLEFRDAIEPALARHFQSFPDSVLGFARWRWYTGWRDDGRHLPDAGAHSDASVILGTPVELAAPVNTPEPTEITVVVRAMTFGTAYVDVTGATDETFDVQLSSTAPVHWVVQALPGDENSHGDDGAFILKDIGTTTTRLVGTRRTLAVTALPSPDFDPELPANTAFAATVTITSGHGRRR